MPSLESGAMPTLDGDEDVLQAWRGLSPCRAPVFLTEAGLSEQLK